MLNVGKQSPFSTLNKPLTLIYSRSSFLKVKIIHSERILTWHCVIPLQPYTSTLIAIRKFQVTGRKRIYFVIIGGTRSWVTTPFLSVLPAKTYTWKAEHKAVWQSWNWLIFWQRNAPQVCLWIWGILIISNHPIGTFLIWSLIQQLPNNQSSSVLPSLYFFLFPRKIGKSLHRRYIEACMTSPIPPAYRTLVLLYV